MSHLKTVESNVHNCCTLVYSLSPLFHAIAVKVVFHCYFISCKICFGAHLTHLKYMFLHVNRTIITSTAVHCLCSKRFSDNLYVCSMTVFVHVYFQNRISEKPSCHETQRVLSDGICSVGAGVYIEPEVHLRNCVVLPHRNVGDAQGCPRRTGNRFGNAEGRA